MIQIGLETADSRGSDASNPTVSVVICAYTEKRWDDICAAVTSVHEQIYPAHELFVIVDYNGALYARSSAELPYATVLQNTHNKGLSGARNTGIDAASGEIVAFLDDDAKAHGEWLNNLVGPFSDRRVIAVGGAVIPMWPPHGPPDWLPPEFFWVVGCSYEGLPEQRSPVRNPIGANMSFRRSLLSQTGGFAEAIGRNDASLLPLGCEETELSIRSQRANPGSMVIYDPCAIVYHRVTDDRVTYRYFGSRCYSEGVSKAAISNLVGSSASLASEATYVRRVLPRAARRELGGFIASLRPSYIGRLCTIAIGTSAAGVGYVKTRMSQLVRQFLGR